VTGETRSGGGEGSGVSAIDEGGLSDADADAGDAAAGDAGVSPPGVVASATLADSAARASVRMSEHRRSTVLTTCSTSRERWCLRRCRL
jgi:hypothetical protein